MQKAEGKIPIYEEEIPPKYLEMSFIPRIYDKLYGITPDATAQLANRFHGIITAANEQTGLQVVILIEEYDAPLQHSWKTHFNQKMSAIEDIFCVIYAVYTNKMLNFATKMI